MFNTITPRRRQERHTNRVASCHTTLIVAAIFTPLRSPAKSIWRVIEKPWRRHLPCLSHITPSGTISCHAIVHATTHHHAELSRARKRLGCTLNSPCLNSVCHEIHTPTVTPVTTDQLNVYLGRNVGSLSVSPSEQPPPSPNVGKPPPPTRQHSPPSCL